MPSLGGGQGRAWGRHRGNISKEMTQLVLLLSFGREASEGVRQTQRKYKQRNGVGYAKLG